jgi:tetratricopeptide (TPR) repeat protein
MLLKSTASAKRTRRRMILVSLPVVLLALFVAWKLLSMPLFAQQAIDAYDEGNYDRAVETSDSLMFLNIAENWIPYFNRGTANAAAQSYSDATDDLAKALERAPEERRCDVRVNLALAWEMQGDSYFEAGYFTGARKLYETAKAVLDAGADEGCFEQQPPEQEEQGEEESSPQQPDGDTAERLEQADERVTEKLRQSERQEESEQPEPDAGESEDADGGGGKVDELKERSDEAEKEKQNQDSTQRGQDGSRNYVEKPW